MTRPPQQVAIEPAKNGNDEMKRCALISVPMLSLCACFGAPVAPDTPVIRRRMQHPRAPHFRKYLALTAGMIASRVLVKAVPVELREKFNTPPVDNPVAAV